MISKKICLLGAPSVGKTSLVRRFVHQAFSEKYLTTVGVKVDFKVVTVDGASLKLIIWDVEGKHEGEQVRGAYLKGAAGLILAVDSTRPATLKAAQALREQANDVCGQAVSAVVVLTKCDLPPELSLEDEGLAQLGAGAPLRTSSLTGEGVEQAFEALASQLLSR